MLTVLRAALLTMLVGAAFASTALAGGSEGDHQPRGRAWLLSDAELEAVSGAGEACRENAGEHCVLEPRVGPLTRVILWDERVGSRSRRLWEGVDLAQRRIGRSARLESPRRP